MEAITELGTGEALVSFLDEKGIPSVVERATILPPQSMMGIIDNDRRKAEIESDELFGIYEESIDNESAYELLKKERDAIELEEAERLKQAEQEKKVAAEEKKKEKEMAASKKKSKSALSKVANSTVNSIGREIGRSVARGLLGTIKKWF